jgi:WD40 repeat protein
MSDVFVSYSRRDSEFVRRMADSIAARGKEVWLDTEGIADGEVFPEAIKRAIESSDAFLFVITPDSVGSAYCDHEVEYARQMQKRIVPVLREPVPDSELPAEIRDRNWIPFTDDASFDPSMGRLVTALDTDLEATKAHTRWLVKALEWDKEGRDNSFLLRGLELKAAEEWLASRPEDADPTPTTLQREYLLASRTAAARRQRMLMIGSAVVAAVSVGLLIFALISRGQAVSERVSARSQALAAESQAQLPNDPEISVILGMRAVRTKATPQSMLALRAALDASPLELSLPHVNVPGACGNSVLGLAAAYSPDGGQIAETVCSGSVRWFDAASGRLLRVTQVGRGASSAAYSPDGTSVAVGTGPGVALLETHSGRVLRRLGAGSSPGGRPAQTMAVAFSPNGRLLAASTPGEVTAWSLPSGRFRTLAHVPAQGFSLAFSPDGRLLYAGSFDAMVHVYDVATSRQVRQIDPFPAAHGSSPWPLVVATSHDGTRVAVAYPDGSGAGVVALYSTRTWRKLFDVVSIPSVEIASLSFSPDDTRLAVGAEDGTAGVWSLVAREQLAAYDGPTAAVNSVAFTPDGRRVLTASNDGVTRVWRATGSERSFVPIYASVDFMSLRGNTLEVLASSSAGGAWLSWYRLPGGQLFRRVTLLSPQIHGFPSISPDGRVAFVARFAASRNQVPSAATMTIVDAASGKVVHRLGSALVEQQGYPTFSPDDSKLILLETTNAKTVAGPGGEGPGIVGAEQLKAVTLATGRAVTLFHAQPCGPGAVVRWAFSGDGKRVAQASFCGIVEVWDTRTGRLLQTVDQGAETSAVALNHDGTRLLVASWDSRATMWSVATGRRLVDFVGHTRGIAAAALNADGTRLITGSLDRTLRVWDARTGQILRVLTFNTAPAPVAFSIDGREFALEENTPIAGVPNIVRVFDTCPGCQNPTALLKLAAPRATTNLTQLESTVRAGS